MATAASSEPEIEQSQVSELPPLQESQELEDIVAVVEEEEEENKNDSGGSTAVSGDSTSKEHESVVTPDVGEFERSSFGIHLKRQAHLCKLALQDRYKYLPESVSEIGLAFEEFLFNPVTEADKKQQEARLNLFPPFVIPECTACYSSFFSIMPLPFSCIANRTGTAKLKKLKEIEKYDYLPKFDGDLFVIADGLGGEVTAIDSLPRKTRLVNLDFDYDRLRVVKEKLTYVTQFAYPALNIPPKIHKALVEGLYKPIQTGSEAVEEVGYVFDDNVILSMISDDVKTGRDPLELIAEFRKNLLRAIQYVAPLQLMQAIFRNAGFIKKVQEILHYTFHHGYVRLIAGITQRNLSNFVTFHGMTFENRNNNSCLHTTLDLNDGEDYMVDCIFLFLIMTWQTMMGIWQQNLNDGNMGMLTNILKAHGPALIRAFTTEKISAVIVDWISDNKELIKIFHQSAPDFTSQTQLNNFRNFVLARSNIAGCIVPAMVKDFVPIDFKESPPRLWQHVYLLHLSYYLYNHGDYCQTFFFTDTDTKCPENEVFCNCNLCAPHRVPLYNAALHNEILAIGTFDFYVPDKDGKGGQRLTLTPGMWANKYLDHFYPDDYYPFEVKKYLDYPELFKREPTACVITKPNVLSSIQQLQRQRTKFLLERGSGIYLDPQTGENLSDTKLLSQSSGLPKKQLSSSSKARRGVTQDKEEEKKKKNTR